MEHKAVLYWQSAALNSGEVNNATPNKATLKSGTFNIK